LRLRRKLLFDSFAAWLGRQAATPVRPALDA